jgi:hypothetical protein
MTFLVGALAALFATLWMLELSRHDIHEDEEE